MNAALPFFVEPNDPPSKQELLKAALKLFARDGVRESSIRAVASEAGFTNPVLFKYFESKDALALHLFERCYLRMVREATAAVAGKAPFPERLEKLVLRLLELYDEAPDAVLFVNEELRHFWPLLPGATRKHSLLGMTGAFLQEGERTGHVTSTIDRKLLVAGFWGLLGQFGRMHAFDEWRGRAVDAAPAIAELALKLFKP